METLTPEQKIAAYQYCIDEIIKYYPNYKYTTRATPFMCILLKRWLHDNMSIFYDLQDCFPEFFKCKPVELPTPDYTAWYYTNDLGIIHRIVTLEWCIEEVKSHIK